MNFFMPTRLFTGDDCIYQHRDELSALGGRCLVVTGHTSAKASGALDDVCRALEGCGATSVIWDGVTEDPPLVACREAGRVAADAGARFILGVGGGSALDAANPELDEDGFYAKAWETQPLPIALVGTTAGTGSEVTKVSVLTDSRGRKHSIHDDRLYAAVAFGDSRHTHTCSRAVTLSCGVDVIAHATESYFSRKADQISRACAVRAIRLAYEPLATAAAFEELSPAQREALYDASILGGLAINTTGTCFPHNVGYYLTENYHVPHGFACAVFLPEMLKQVRAYDEAYAAAFYDEVGTIEEALVTLIENCLPSFDIHMDAAEIAAALPRWENNGSVKNTRANVSVEMIGQMLEALFK